MSKSSTLYTIFRPTPSPAAASDTRIARLEKRMPARATSSPSERRTHAPTMAVECDWISRPGSVTLVIFGGPYCAENTWYTV